MIFKENSSWGKFRDPDRTECLRLNRLIDELKDSSMLINLTVIVNAKQPTSTRHEIKLFPSKEST